MMTTITTSKEEKLKAAFHDRVRELLSPERATSLLFSHFGEFDAQKIDATLAVIEQSILENGERRSSMKRICTLLIEVLQNISIHGAHDRSGRMFASCILAKDGDYYYVTASNLILAEEIPVLHERMNYLNSLSLPEIRKAYIDVLCNDEFSDAGGAGLGLLTIAKRARRPIQFSCEVIDEFFGHYTIEVAIPVHE